MIAPEERQRLRASLETDRVWCAYALADLEPDKDPLTAWHRSGSAVLLAYRGVTPPVLFAHGDPHEAEALLDGVGSGEYQFALQGVHHSLWVAGGGDRGPGAGHPRLEVINQTRMWRMVLKPEDFPGGEDQGCLALTPDDTDRLRVLFGEHPDRPDSFHPSQLDRGVFRAIAEGEELVAVAGTHVVSDSASVAAVGNVYTRPDRRGRGYGRKTSAAVTSDLLRRGIRTIVLNVAMDNAPALAVYRRLGFMPFCGYYEGVGVLIDLGER